MRAVAMFWVLSPIPPSTVIELMRLGALAALSTNPQSLCHLHPPFVLLGLLYHIFYDLSSTSSQIPARFPVGFQQSPQQGLNLH